MIITPMAYIGLLCMLSGAAASYWGSSMRLSTIQVPGNTRIHVGTAMSFLGGLALSIGCVSFLLSF